MGNGDLKGVEVNSFWHSCQRPGVWVLCPRPLPQRGAQGPVGAGLPSPMCGGVTSVQNSLRAPVLRLAERQHPLCSCTHEEGRPTSAVNGQEAAVLQ